ncbi:CHAD domain-containing protein [Pontiella sp.]|uniref:CHAD domain-containing protein n=1 Tax=Pontiella sp. TaxID=2837462 RepID=UPI0035695776
MLPLSSYCRTGSFRAGRIAKGLPGGYAVAPLSETAFRGALLDSFDGHLRRAGQVLLQLKDRVLLLDLPSGAVAEQERAAGWKFAAELNGGEVGGPLLERSALRAFLPVCEIELTQSRVAVLDDSGKTVVRATVSVLKKGGKRATWMTIHPLRGYAGDRARLEQAVVADGFSVAEQVDYYPLLGLRRALYESRPAIPLDGNAPVFDSAGAIVRTFLDVARKNEPGLVEDLDTEFLHDYRVSLRRVRSLLSLFKGVYADGDARRMKAELADIMKQTNRLRDLDVYLLGRSGYYAMVPQTMHAGLDLMFGVLEAERREALEQVHALFRCAKYGPRMKALSGPMGKGPAADEPTLHYAQRLILKHYRKVVAIGKTIDAETPDATVHELRIQCKKLRYLMEFFLPLFPDPAGKSLLKPLKGLQDVLGRFNDYSVQRHSLAEFAGQHPIRGKKGLRLAESIGALVATLYQLQLQARGEVEAGLAGFANRQTRQAFNKRFAAKTGGESA